MFNWIKNKIAERNPDKWGKKEKTRAIVYRKRGSEDYVPDFTYAQRYVYDELPNLHKMDTGEETKAVPLRAVKKSISDNEQVEIYDCPGSDEVIIGKKVPKSGVFNYDLSGNPVVHLAEPEDGQFIPFTFKETDVEGEGDTDKGHIRPYLIKNLDERLTAFVEHLRRAVEKYNANSFFQRHQKVILIAATGFSIAVIYIAAASAFGDTLPVMQALTDKMGVLKNVISKFAESTGATPPPGS